MDLGFHINSRGLSLYPAQCVQTVLVARAHKQRPYDTCTECSVKAYCVNPFLFTLCLMVVLETLQTVLLSNWDMLLWELATLGLFRKLLPFHNLNVCLSLFNWKVARSERFVCLNCSKAALTFGCRGNCFNVELYSSGFKVPVLLWFVHSLGWELFQWETVSK